jgi:hypothetical protein
MQAAEVCEQRGAQLSMGRLGINHVHVTTPAW